MEREMGGRGPGAVEDRTEGEFVGERVVNHHPLSAYTHVFPATISPLPPTPVVCCLRGGDRFVFSRRYKANHHHSAHCLFWSALLVIDIVSPTTHDDFTNHTQHPDCLLSPLPLPSPTPICFARTNHSRWIASPPTAWAAPTHAPK